MNSQEILKSLSNLEQKLQSIETARQQVERTVNAYDGARTQLVKLTQDMSSVSLEMNKVISMITTNQETLSGELSKKTDDVFKGIHTQIQNLNKETTTIKQDFASACQVAISNFVNANTANQERFSKDILELTAKVNTNAESEIKKVSSTLGNFQASLLEIQKKYETSISSSIEEQKKTSLSIASDFKKSVDKYTGAMSQTKTDMDSILAQYKKLIEKYNSMLETVLKETNKQIQGISSQINSINENESKQFGLLQDKLQDLTTANGKSYKLIIVLLIGLIISIIINVIACLPVLTK